MEWIIFSILVLLVLLGFLSVAIAKRKERVPTDYYALFVMGLVWLPTGIFMLIFVSDFTLGYIFAVLGFIYMVMGLVHKDEWEKNRKTWKKMRSKERLLISIILVVLGLFVLAGLLVFYLVKKGII